MPKYIPSPRDWVREQVELYEGSGGTKSTTLLDTGLPVIIVTNTSNKTGAIRKTPLMRVKDGANYVLAGSQGGAPTHPVWVHNLAREPGRRDTRPYAGAADASARGRGRSGAGTALEACRRRVSALSQLWRGPRLGSARRDPNAPACDRWPGRARGAGRDRSRGVAPVICMRPP